MGIVGDMKSANVNVPVAQSDAPKVKKVWTTPKIKDVPIFFEVSLYAATR